MDFYQKRKIFYLIAIVFLVIGLGSLAIQGINKGIDFQSGTLVAVSFKSDVAMDQLRGVLKDYGLENSVITQDGEGAYTIKAVEISQEDQTKLLDGFTEKLGEYELQRVESVGPTVGKELTQNAILALAMASVLMIIYVSIRFRLKFAVSAVLCLLHDVLIMLSVFSLFQIEVESSFIAAILTIVGYSINNTIVIFDRIRENMKLSPKAAIGELVNSSIGQSMTRSINMVVTVLAVLLCLLFLGGETTRILALALVIGNVAGFYSSVFISGNLWADLEGAGGKKKKK
ncbi:MAG: protein translocase subunit SecF [Peptococcaceae bacterium]|nr:protein translocase subunit SecF [Peptococcaceae bacterium]